MLARGVAVRRGVVAAVYALLAVLLARAVAADLAWVRRSLRTIGASLPDLVTALAEDPANVALIGLAALAFSLAVGTFLASRETASAFAILAAATVGWFLFPYAEVPWATVLTGAEIATVTAPAITWWLGGAILLLATLEVLTSAREHLLDTLHAAGLPTDATTSLATRSRATTARLVTGTVLLGTGLTLAYALARDTFLVGPLTEPDLLWVPILLGAIIAGVLWYSGRDAR